MIYFKSKPFNKYTEDLFITNLRESCYYSDSETSTINSLIPKHLQNNIEFSHLENEKKLTESKRIYKIVDPEITGDLDEVVVDVNNFSFWNYFKDLYFNGNPENKQDWFFFYFGRLLRFTIFLMIFNKLHEIYRQKMETADKTNMVASKNSFKDLFYKKEWELHTKYGQTISDIRNLDH